MCIVSADNPMCDQGEEQGRKEVWCLAVPENRLCFLVTLLEIPGFGFSRNRISLFYLPSRRIRFHGQHLAEGPSPAVPISLQEYEGGKNGN